MEALDRVGLSSRAAVRVSELSHGEKRLLEIAMALAMRPRIFLMDEPMAGLGHEGSARLIGFLDKLRSEAPILLIEHDMDAVFQLADRISVLVSRKDHRPRQCRRDPQPSGSAYRLSRGGRGMSLLEVSKLEAFYGASQALFGVDLEIAEGELVALMGRNGMGQDHHRARHHAHAPDHARRDPL
jgi:ABC-type branched-subunit amino acid transport system ATPase component